MTLRRIFPALPLNLPLRPNPSYSPVPCVYTVTTLTTTSLAATQADLARRLRPADHRNE